MKIPDTPTTAFICVTFLAKWFELAGEQEEVSWIEFITLYFLFINVCLMYYQPNAAEIHIDPIDEKEVWNYYKSDPFVQSHDKDYFYDTFTRIWRDVFP